MKSDITRKIHPTHNLFRKPALSKQVMCGIKTAPKDPGVYIFYHNQIPLYVGKDSNLKNRLQSYLKITDFKTEALHREANKLKLIKLRSNIEALITESQMIKTLRPKLNILWKDDKNYFYVAITKEKFPRIYITHQPSNIQHLTSNLVGPFTDGQSIKAVLRLLRKFFPYCTCFQPHLRLCLNAQIGNCSGYCCQRDTNIQMRADDTNNTNIKIYQKNIRKIKNILTGKDKKFIRQLKDPYELLVLEKIWRHKPYLEVNRRVDISFPKPPQAFELGPPLSLRSNRRSNAEDKVSPALDGAKRVEERDSASRLIQNIQKVECYDNSHLSGKEAVGAMTAWLKKANVWTADKNSWRKFKIRGHYTEDDPRMMEEVLSRRLNHPEWPYPDLIIIDGGITQFNAAKTALRKSQITNPKLQIIAFAKPQKLVYGWEKNPTPINKLPVELQKLIPTAIQHTHNFVQRYHRQVRRGAFLAL